MSHADKPDAEDRLINRRVFLQRLGFGMAGLLALSACGSEEPEHFVVTIGRANQFEPAVLTIPKGARVTWQNQSLYPHSATCDPAVASGEVHGKIPSGGEKWDSGALYPGQKWSHTFDTPGDYVYISRFDEKGSVIGTITVRA